MRELIRLSIGGAACAAAFGCHDSTSQPNTEPRSVIGFAASPVTQSATVNSLVGAPPAIRVLDRAGIPVIGARVIFTAPDRVGLVTSPVVTGGDGVAATTWLLHWKAREYTLVASVVGSTASSVVFHAIALPDTAATLTTSADLNLAGLPSSLVPSSRAEVRVLDTYRNGVPGVTVTFEVTSGGGLVVPQSATTDSAGRVSVGAWMLGPDTTENTLTVRALRLAPLTFRGRINRPFAVSGIAAGGLHSCAIASAGDLFCWGNNDRGQLGVTNKPLTALPLKVSDEHRFLSVSAGLAHTCAIADEVPRQAYCWGADGNSQLGRGETSGSRSVPGRVQTSAEFTMITAGARHTCGLTPAGEAFCWGDNTGGQLGNEGSSSNTPVKVAGTTRFKSLVAGDQHTCGITAKDETYCWGYDQHGQLGGATAGLCADQEISYYSYSIAPLVVECARTPQAVPGTPPFVAIAASYGTCGLVATGEVYCWGYGKDGYISNSVRFAQISATGTCGTATDGAAHCWTWGESGAVLARTGRGFTFSSVTSGASHECGILTSTAFVVCWGNNEFGQLGNGTTALSDTPLPVAKPAIP